LLNNGIDLFGTKQNKQADTSGVITQRTYYVKYEGDAGKIDRLGAKYTDYVDFVYYSDAEGGEYSELPTSDLLMLKTDASNFPALSQDQSMPLLKITFTNQVYISQNDSGKISTISGVSDITPVVCIYNSCSDPSQVLDKTTCECSSQDNSLNRTYIYKGNGSNLSAGYSNYVYFTGSDSASDKYLLSKDESSKIPDLVDGNLGKEMFFSFKSTKVLTTVDGGRYIEISGVEELNVVNSFVVVYKGDAATLSKDYDGYGYFQYNDPDGSSKIFLVSDDSIKSNAPKSGKMYLLTYTNTTFIGVATNVCYERLSGAFSYVQK
jgi:hypothetical protein